jgi:hypothetical protein
MLPQIGTDVVRGVVRADHDRFLAAIRLARRVPARVILFTLERLGASDRGCHWQPGDTRRKHQVLGPQSHGRPVAFDVNTPLASRGVKHRVPATVEPQ